MKERYDALEMEVITFDTEDIIITSVIGGVEED